MSIRNEITKAGRESRDLPKRDPSRNLCAVTVRFSQETWEVIRRIAEQNHTNMAQVIRYAVAGNIAQYLGSMRYIDRAQGEEIKSLLMGLTNELAGIRMELNRIGVNYNQEVRLLNIKRKYKGVMDVSSILRMKQEEDEARQECGAISREDLDRLMRRFDATIRKAGDTLCRILV